MLSALSIAAPLLGYPNVDAVEWDSVHPSSVLMLRDQLEHCGHPRSTNCRILAGVNGALKEAARSRLADPATCSTPAQHIEYGIYGNRQGGA